MASHDLILIKQNVEHRAARFRAPDDADAMGLYLGRQLRRRRRSLGLTQQALGELCGVSFQQIQKYECAGSQVSAVRLWRLACALEVEVGYFFDGLVGGEDEAGAASADSRSFSPSP